jgi:hypothetical protein
MDLTETFQAVAPGVVAFAQTRVLAPAGSPPLSPLIFATGFVVDPVGIVATNRHVIEAFAKMPPDPKTGKPAVAAIFFHYGRTDQGKDYVRWIPIELKYYTTLENFKSDGQWYGEAVPDIGFAQLMLKDLPALKLATKDNYVRIGMPVATAGFPMGDVPLTMMQRLNQMTPFLRRGIVSSVFPFPVAQPHGFTIDIIQQGGSSGSPIFYVDRPEVVGMMSSSLPDSEYVEQDGKMVEHVQNTNISICVTAGSISHALATFKAQYQPKLDGVRPLAEHLETVPMKTSMGWEVGGVTEITTDF